MESELTLAAARQIADEAIRKATRLDLRISVAVADEAGAFRRQPAAEEPLASTGG